MLRVGCVEYINALPFHLPFQLKKIESDVAFIFDIPSKLNHMLQKRELDIALTSCVEYLDGDYELLQGFGIAARKKVLSVNLYTQLPLTSLNGARIGVTHHSATSISLLKVLCHHFWKVTPYFEPFMRSDPITHYDAILLIGDEALKNFSIPGFETIDLAAAWYQMTGLPFVFAVFAVRKELETSASQVALFEDQLGRALDWSDLNRQCVENEALKRCALPTELVRQYYTCLQYRLGKEEIEGLKTFTLLRKELPDVSTVCT